MTATLALHDALMPRPPGGQRVGAAAALVLHVVLLACLATVVQWRTQPAEVFTAELWDRMPQSAPIKATPPPPPQPVEPPRVPAPTPQAPTPDADIALEQQSRRKAEQAREQAEREAAREAAKKAAANKAQAEAQARQDKLKAQADKTQRDKQAAAERAQDERLAQLREANLKRIIGAAATAEGSGGASAREGGPSAGYMARLAAQIRRNLVYTGQFKSGPPAEVMVRAGPSGTIISRVLSKSSGHPDWDEAVLRALDGTNRLEPDVDGRVPSELIISFKPGD